MEKTKERKQEKALRRKAYEKPRIVYQQSLEEVAAGCTGIGTAKLVEEVGGCSFVGS